MPLRPPRRGAARAVGVGRLARRPRLGPPLRGRRLARAAAGPPRRRGRGRRRGDPRRAGRGRGRRPAVRSGTASGPACAGSWSTSSRSTPGTTATPTCSASPSTATVATWDPPRHRGRLAGPLAGLPRHGRRRARRTRTPRASPPTRPATCGWNARPGSRSCSRRTASCSARPRWAEPARPRRPRRHGVVHGRPRRPGPRGRAAARGVRRRLAPRAGLPRHPVQRRGRDQHRRGRGCGSRSASRSSAPFRGRSGRAAHGYVGLHVMYLSLEEEQP